MRQRLSFSGYAWAVVVYLIGVILWGAWVRITGSGAGCGAHWPTCHGAIIPPSPTMETLIEFTHRLSSGLCLPLVLMLLVWAFQRFPKGHRVRMATVGTLIFLLSESAVGAGLVKFELVAGDTSVARAITATAHLINTFTLTAFAALSAWWGRSSAPAFAWHWRSRASLLLLPGLAAILLVSMMGAVTALGDTLFPTTVFAEQGLVARLREDLSVSTHFLVQLRIVHPLLAVLSGLYLLLALPLAQESLSESASRRGMRWVNGLLIAQLLLGLVNILLAAPGWMQIVHLLTAVVLWLGLLLYWVWSQEQLTAQTAPQPANRSEIPTH
ncbi:MAG: COX15/CtaA family protein [Candidatus Sericytochromatia bacterium]|nr:COX15/CtaA family protein [Candidatus Sericytochromatia bacterium]